MTVTIGEVRRTSALRWTLEGLYVAAIAALTTIATSDPNNFTRWAWAAVLILTLPGLLAMLPLLYLAASTAWNLTGADTGGVQWPVTATYVVVLTLAAVANVVLLRLVTSAYRIRRDRARLAT